MTKPIGRRPRRKTLTDKMVEELEREPKSYLHPDPGLGGHYVRVQPKGPPHGFYVVARDAYKKQRWVKIGSTAELKIVESRETARSVLKRLKAGEAPFPPPPVKKDSVAAVAATWLRRHVKARGLRSAAEIERIIRKYILPTWADRPFAELRRSDVAELLDHLEDKHGAFVADTALNVLRSMGNWFASRNDNFQLPFVRGMRRVASQARKRSRVLSDDELRCVWRTAEHAGGYGGLVQLLLPTAQRREKVATMRWSDVAEDGTWTIPTAARAPMIPSSASGHASTRSAPRSREFIVM